MGQSAGKETWEYAVVGRSAQGEGRNGAKANGTGRKRKGARGNSIGEVRVEVELIEPLSR